MKKLCSMILILCLVISSNLVSTNATVSADEGIKVMFNGKAIQFDVPPTTISERTMVPMRAVFEALGADVYWDDELQLVFIVKNEIKIGIIIGQYNAFKYTGYSLDELKKSDGSNIQNLELDVAPQIIDGRTLIPLRVICEAMGVNVAWDEESQTVLLTCSEDFIAKSNTDKTFYNDFITYLKDEFKKSAPLHSAPGALNQMIPTNISTNIVWGGEMCEANGMVFFITTASDSSSGKSHIERMNPDGTEQTSVSDDYSYIGNLVSDNNNIYFTANTTSSYEGANVIYSLPIAGGQISEVAEGNINGLQMTKDRLYWTDCPRPPSGEIKRGQTKPLAIKSAKKDGSDLQVLFSTNVPLAIYTFDFLATDAGLYYYTQGSDYDHCNIYCMDLEGKNTVKLNKNELNQIDKLFYDNGNLYLVIHSDELDFRDSVVTLDSGGNVQTIIDSIGYFPQDFSVIQYCGVSDHVFYYFELDSGTDSSKKLLMSLHQYDIKSKTDSIVKNNIEMGDSAVGTLQSARGKSIPCKGVTGFYIVGNDIYFEPFSLP